MTCRFSLLFFILYTPEIFKNISLICSTVIIPASDRIEINLVCWRDLHLVNSDEGNIAIFVVWTGIIEWHGFLIKISWFNNEITVSKVYKLYLRSLEVLKREYHKSLPRHYSPQCRLPGTAFYIFRKHFANLNSYICVVPRLLNSKRRLCNDIEKQTRISQRSGYIVINVD